MTLRCRIEVDNVENLDDLFRRLSWLAGFENENREHIIEDLQPGKAIYRSEGCLENGEVEYRFQIELEG